MKFIIQLLFICCAYNFSAQSSIKTQTILVKGICDECKERIENAADIKGVKKCTWNKDTKIATVVFDDKKTTISAIEKAIAYIGYDTEHEKANPVGYKKLPECCQVHHPANKPH
jgi:periplasmic mercuric ion binding protein